MILQNKSLLRSKAYINGEWISANNGASYKISNPFNGEIIATLPDLGRDETKMAIEKSDIAQKVWKTKTAGERSNILRKWFDLMMENKEDLGYILTIEQGKPLKEAIGEVVYGASFIEWFAEEAKRTYGDVIPSHAKDIRIVTIKQAIGVVAAITPWNFPNSMITRKAGAALAAGCSIVVKPAKNTPLSALALAVLADEAGIPPGVFNIITSNRSSEIGDELTSNPIIRKLSFTGSTEVGKVLIKKCADTVKKVSMELGGNAPFIVFADADINKAVEGVMISKFRNSGQTCVCSNRIYAHSSIYKEFTEKLSKEVNKLHLGNGLEEGTNIGPMINLKAVNFVTKLVNDAKEKGAKVITGGCCSDIGKTFYKPTVLTDVDTSMDVHKQEIFGPIAPVFKFETESEVVQLANDTEYGLAAYFYGRDYAMIWRVAEALEYGMVGINTGLISTTLAPFGGIKESGFGREGSKYGIDEYLEIKYMCFGDVS
ncbi:MAG: NAD-dependent succinate-semialdehyde dehydrogenase [Flavobacteriales bacterium]|nr:NAD-dependent succinate-semialdehyde dehydrogenase [Flavobacteriales bacterium]